VEETMDVRITSQTCVGVGKKGNAAFFCDYVTKIITHNEAFGETREDRTKLLYRGGLDIYTTLDPKLQEQAQKAAMDAVPKDDESGVATSIVTDRKSTRLNSSHVSISYAVFCLKKKKKKRQR